MRLLNVKTGKLEDFLSPDDVSTAILSHTWGKGEVTFHDIHQPAAEQSKLEGFSKLQGCCSLVKSHGFDYVWIDTCCINKESSAELSEAINSMYDWYSKAAVCYVYLNDVRVTTGSAGAPTSIVTDFRCSRWHSRGWTLQELLAPSTVIFYSKEWIELVTREDLRGIISECTQISIEVLQGQPLSSICIATKMSWAAARLTTRTEDMAYCLLGLFNISMPILYGEGHNAFFRLQQEILRFSSDQSIFAWSESDESNGFLAYFPAAFENCVREVREPKAISPTAMTNLGIHIELELYENQEDKNHFLAALECEVPRDGRSDYLRSPGPVFLELRKISEIQYVRTGLRTVSKYQALDRIFSPKGTHYVYVKQSPPSKYLSGHTSDRGLYPP